MGDPRGRRSSPPAAHSSPRRNTVWSQRRVTMLLVPDDDLRASVPSSLATGVGVGALAALGSFTLLRLACDLVRRGVGACCARVVGL